MPIYEYQCQKCGEVSEFLQKVNEAPKSTCPKCHQQALKKLISSTSFQLKGEGWYVTDFKNPQKKPEAKSATPPPQSSQDNKTASSTDNTTSTGGQKDKKD